MKKHFFVSVVVLCCLAVAQDNAKTTSKQAAAKPASKAASAAHKNAFTPDQIQYGAAPAFLPSGAQLAVLEGNPMAATGDYTVRLKIPDGYKVAPHWHPKRENVTVISGTLKVGMGDKFDPAALEQLPTGSFAFMSKEMRHFASCIGETIVQLHGMGPFVSNYVNPADDPDKKNP